MGTAPALPGMSLSPSLDVGKPFGSTPTDPRYYQLSAQGQALYWERIKYGRNPFIISTPDTGLAGKLATGIYDVEKVVAPAIIGGVLIGTAAGAYGTIGEGGGWGASEAAAGGAGSVINVPPPTEVGGSIDFPFGSDYAGMPASGAETSLSSEEIAAQFGMENIGPTVGPEPGNIGGNIDMPFGEDYAGEPLTNSGAGATPSTNYLSTAKDVLGIGTAAKSLFSGATSLLQAGKGFINEVFGGGGASTTPGSVSMGGGESGGGILSAKTLPWFLIGFVLIGALILKGRK